MATETSIPQEVPQEIQQEIPQENSEKAMTTNNSVMYYHDEVTHPGDVHEECVVQKHCW